MKNFKTGIRIKLTNPDDETQPINAVFATVRSNPELLELINKIAEADTAETIASKKAELIHQKIRFAETEKEIKAVEKEYYDAVKNTTNSSMVLFDAIRDFVYQGYKLAGATDERAKMLTDVTDVEYLQLLKAKCMYGAGSLDFTLPEDQ